MDSFLGPLPEANGLPLSASPLASVLDSLEKTLPSKLLTDDEGPTLIDGFGRLSVPVEAFNRCIELRNACEGCGAKPSSLLSDGRRYRAGASIVDVRFEGSFGIADGHKVFRGPSWLTLDFEETLDSILGRPSCGTLCELSVRLSSALAFRFSTISPPPAMMTGLMRSSRNGSWDGILSVDALAALKLRSRVLPPTVPVLLLLPRTAYLPYPSWPVPAAGPFLDGLSLFSAWGISGVVFERLKRPNRGLVFATLGLGVRSAGDLEEGGGTCTGLRSGIIPSPVGCCGGGDDAAPRGTRDDCWASGYPSTEK